MGKPIAGRSQFPFTIGGYLVDGAKINGETFVKKLYIQKQRSYLIFDLVDESGKVYEYVRLGHIDTDGNMLDYFTSSVDLVDTIPNNTFFLKIQDASRGIYSFVRLYQLNKIVTADGNYIFRPENTDTNLSGVIINPLVTTIKKGSTADFVAEFFPHNYEETGGEWGFNNLINTDPNTPLFPVDFNKLVRNSTSVDGIALGQANITFTPERNKLLMASSTIYVIDADTAPDIEYFITVNPLTWKNLRLGESFDVQIITYPFDSVLTEPLDVYIESSKYVTLDKVSSDFKTYTFKSMAYESDDTYIDRPVITFSMNSPIHHAVPFRDISLYSNFKNIDAVPGITYDFKSRYFYPNSTRKLQKSITGPNSQEFPIKSSSKHVTMTNDGVITVGAEADGQVSLTTDFIDLEGNLHTDYLLANIYVQNNVYDYAVFEVDGLNEMKTFEIGSTYHVKAFLVRGNDRKQVNLSSYSSNGITLSNDGTLIIPNDPSLIDTTIDIRINRFGYLFVYDMGISITAMIVGGDGAGRKMTDAILNSGYLYRRDIVPLKMNGEYLPMRVYADPPFCSNYGFKLEPTYDTELISIPNLDIITNYFQYVMYKFEIEVYGQKKGSTELTFTAIHDPSITVSIPVIVY